MAHSPSFFEYPGEYKVGGTCIPLPYLHVDALEVELCICILSNLQYLLNIISDQ